MSLAGVARDQFLHAQIRLFVAGSTGTTIPFRGSNGIAADAANMRLFEIKRVVGLAGGRRGGGVSLLGSALEEDPCRRDIARGKELAAAVHEVLDLSRRERCRSGRGGDDRLFLGRGGG